MAGRFQPRAESKHRAPFIFETHYQEERVGHLVTGIFQEGGNPIEDDYDTIPGRRADPLLVVKPRASVKSL